MPETGNQQSKALRQLIAEITEILLPLYPDQWVCITTTELKEDGERLFHTVILDRSIMEEYSHGIKQTRKGRD